MMDAIVSDFEKSAASIQMNKPQIPIISTVTGKSCGTNEMSDPAYWAKQLRLPVRFAAAIETISESGNYLMLETGPGEVLTAMVRHQGIYKAMPVIASLKEGGDKPEIYKLIHAAGQLWMNGISPDWEAFCHHRKKTTIDLPAYAFDRTRYWVNPDLQEQHAGIHQSNTIITNIVTNPVSEYLPPQKNMSRKAMLTGRLKTIFENASGIEMGMVPEGLNFIEIGFDSLLLTQVSLNLKKEFGLPVTFRQLNETHTTLDSLAGFLDENLPEENFPETPKAAETDDPSSIQYLSRQIEQLAKQVALLQEGNQPLTANRQPPNISELSSGEISELQKPFGASAKIERQSTSLSKKQATFLNEFIQRYNRKTGSSKTYAQVHRSFMSDPRVVSGFKPVTKEIVYPIVVNKSKGSRLWDIDGNEYIDALNGFGSNFLGYQPEIITKALHEQIENGYELGPQHEMAGEVCKLICAFTDSDRAALCNTGSEAVMGAMRIARTVTGRSTIVAFSGSYHGIADEVIVRGAKNGKSFPAAPGIMPEAVQNMLILDYGTEESLAIIKEKAHELAAVLVEPVQSRRPEFQPVDFLKALREITAASGTVLIFDEVITGFRMHPGGVQAMFGIKADLGTYGKVIAGGLPIGVIAGKKLYMDALDGGYWEYGNASGPESGVTYFAGTFVRHPLALAASLASLKYMKEMGPALQESLNEKTRRLADSLNLVCTKKGLPIFIARFGSLWKIKFRDEIPYAELLFSLMREKGIHIWDGFPCFLTTAHREADIHTMVDIFEKSVNELLEAGFLTSAKAFHLMPAIEPQQEIWISCQLGGPDANRSYNESVSLRLKGPLKLLAMERALQEISNRHEALRSTFTDDGKQICIYREKRLNLRYEDLTDKYPEDQEQWISAFAKQDALEVFDLEHGPLCRSSLFKLSEEEHYLSVTAHHIICDGWSLGIILQDLGKYYSAFVKNEEPGLKPAPSFSDYAVAQKHFLETEEYKIIEQYWISQYSQSIPVLNIPTDLPRPPARTYKSHRLDFPMEPELISALKKTGALSGCTLVTSFMAAFEVFLFRVTGHSDVVLGIPAAGQSASGLYGLVGHCVNLLPLRSAPEEIFPFLII